MFRQLMLYPDLQDVIEQIHATPHKLVFEFAGAGSLALWWLHRVAGSSRTVLEATDRYSGSALAALLGEKPEQAVSAATARGMARQAYQRALFLSNAGDSPANPASPLLGVACTATIATTHTKRGDHRCVVAVQDAMGNTTYALTLTKGLRDRISEERLVSQLVIRAISRACELELAVPLDLVAGEALEETFSAASDPLAQLLNGTVRTVAVYPDGREEVDQPAEGAILSGAFNPLHLGHEQLAQVAMNYLNMPMLFELPVINADKGALLLEEVVRRLKQFAGRYTVVFSRAPLFVEKATLFPRSVFIVGYDTAVRLVAPRYYGSETAMRAALTHIQMCHCRFLVAGRVQHGQFRTLRDVAVPPDFHDLFLELPEEQFRVDISSTELRVQARGQALNQ